MSVFFDKIREGAEKAGFEADRLRRLNQAQSMLKTTQRELESQTGVLGRQTLTLYDAGKLTQPELLTTCRQEVDPLRQRIAEQEAHIEQIRQEKPPEAVPKSLYGHICPVCQIELPAEAGFCPRCGSQAVYVPPPSPPAAETCWRCGAMLTPGARFCPNCGASSRPETRAPTKTCPSCQASIPEEAAFCPVCGASTAPSVQEAPQAAEPVTGPDKIVCSVCHASIPAESVFCPECGSSVTEPPTALEREEAWSDAREAVGRIICPNCHASIPAEADFCPECGSSITAPATDLHPEEAWPEAEEAIDGIICPNCGAEIPAEADFCPECGKPIESTVAEVVGEEALPQEELVSAEDEDLAPNEPADIEALPLAETEKTESLPPAEAQENEDLPQEEEMEDQPEGEETPTHIVCPFCQALIPTEAEFCPECGEPIASGPA